MPPIPGSTQANSSVAAVAPSTSETANTHSATLPPPALVSPAENYPPVVGVKGKDLVVDNIALALDVVDSLAEFLRSVPFIAPAAGVLSQLVTAYKETTAANDKRDTLHTQVAEITDDLCATVLRMEATNHVALLTRLKTDVETYAGLLQTASRFIAEHDNLGKVQRFAARNQLGTELNDLQQQMTSFGARFRTNRLVDLSIQQNVIKGTLDEVHDMAIEEKFEKWLRCPPDMARKQHDTQSLRKEGTGEWLVNSEQFIHWQDNASSLWIQGPSGTGKSVLSSTKNWDVHLFFYFDFKNQEAHAVEIALRRIILQLSAQSPHQYKALDKHHMLLKGQTLPTYRDLQQIFEELLLGLGRTYVVFDALDECEDGEIGRLVALISMLQGWTRSPLHLLFTSQPRTTFTEHFSSVPCILLEPKITKNDIKFFVTSELRDNHKLKTWALYRTDEVIDQIVVKSSGMFRLAACLLVEISRSRRHELDTTLQNLPQDLFGIYDRFMETIRRQDLVYATGVLRWLMYSADRRVNALLNLADAVSFKFSSPNYIYDPNLRDENSGLLPKWLEGLVTISDNQLTLAHASVQRYILSERFSDKFGFDLNSGPSHTFIAQSCLGYLRHFADHTLSPDTFNKYSMAAYTAQHLYFHFCNCHDRTVLFDAVHQLLDKGSKQYPAFIKLLGITDGQPKWSSRIPTPLYALSKHGWTEILPLVLKNGGDVDEKDGKYGTALQAASVRGNTETMQFLLDCGANINAQGGEYGTALQAALTLWGRPEVVQFLLDHGADINAQGGKYGCALQAACVECHMESLHVILGARGAASRGRCDCASCTTVDTKPVRVLLERGAAVNTQGGAYGSALQAACTEGHTNVAQLLVEYGADVNVQGGPLGCPLQAASWQGDITNVQLLLQHNADVNTQGGHYGCALQAASERGHTEIVKLLLECKADINTHGGPYGCALTAACMEGHTDVVRLLVEYGADINLQGGELGCALQTACWQGNIKNVQLLLESGADIITQSGKFGFALQAACAKGHTNMVQLLVQYGADVNVQGGAYGRALQAACEEGHTDVAEALAKYGADVNAQGGEYELGCALQAACWQGDIKNVQLLLQHGADVNTRSGKLDFALHAACLKSRKEIVQLLVERGADIDVVGERGSALQAACCQSDTSIVQLLLECGAKVNRQGGKYGCALQAACWKGHKNHAQLLLHNGADTNLQGGKLGSALQAACGQGDIDIAKLLLERNADVNKQGGAYGCALNAACLEGHTNVAQFLVEYGADVNVQGGELGCALQAACWQGDIKNVQLLLEHGADVNKQSGKFGFALQAACLKSHREIVQLLVGRGADVNAQGGLLGSALLAASTSADSASARVLLERGANVNGHGGIHGAALQAACAESNMDMVQLLLEHGAAVNGRSGAYGSALHVASHEGKTSIVRLLLENGADVNAPGGLPGALSQICREFVPEILPFLTALSPDELNEQFGWAGSALEAAHSKGHTDIVELLLERGAVDARAKSPAKKPPY
ncbi:ankyrin repeat-containing domain protein [Mycena crocata]|nr:ankyrin repeat-containing domain protein [Mycena crocata]